MLSAEDILAIPDIVTEEVEVPEWKTTVLVRGLAAEERDAMEQAIVETRGKRVKTNLANIRARLTALSVVDEHGNRVFSDEQIEALGRKSAAALDRIFAVAQRLSGLQREDVEELAKNSETGRK